MVQDLSWYACPEHNELRVSALNVASFQSSLHGDQEGARSFAEESLRIARELGDPRQLGYALASIPRVMLQDRDIDVLLDVTEEGIAIAQQIGDADLLGLHLLLRAEGMRLVHKNAEARLLYQESLDLYRELEATEMVTGGLHNLIEVELDEGNLERAAALLQEKVEVARQLAECDDRFVHPSVFRATCRRTREYARCRPTPGCHIAAVPIDRCVCRRTRTGRV